MQGTVVRGQKENIQNGPTENKKLEDEGGASAEGGQIVQYRYTCRRSPRRESQYYGKGGSSESESCQEL